MKNRVFIIAEAGVNHNGSLAQAIQLVDAAAESGADAVKFQTFKADKLVSRAAPKAEYQIESTGASESQHEMIRKLELDEAAHLSLKQHCRSKNIEFLSTPFDLESLDMLVSRFDLSFIKLASGEITNAPFLLAAARTGKPVILSTGMSDLGDVENALGVLAFGYACHEAAPSLAAFKAAYCSEDGQSVLRGRVTLLHCTTEYPAPLAEVNLRAMETLRQAFGLSVGYSDHTAGIAIPIAAAALGATVIEKHFTLDRNLPGPDHKASLEPHELTEMVRAIRQVEQSLGSPCKAPTPSELKNRPVARKSLVAARDISPGEAFTAENLAIKRPGNGISPLHYWDWLGKAASRPYAADESIEP
jgi:N-acetylneuraminate synthase